MFRIDKRNPHIRNIFSFIILSLLFLSAIQSIATGLNLLKTQGFLTYLKENSLILFMSLILIVLVNKFKKYSKYFLAAFILLVLVKCALLLTLTFNKLILIFVFIYLLYSFFFYTDWELFLDLAANTPLFSANDLEKDIMFKINGQITVEKENYEFKLSNLDEKSCFLLFKERPNLKLGEVFELNIKYENVVFTAFVKCVSFYDLGAGFVFENNNNRHSLSELYQVCLDRGFFS